LDWSQSKIFVVSYLVDKVNAAVHTNTGITGITGITSQCRKIQCTTYSVSPKSNLP